MTKAQRALNDLEIVLDDVLDDKNEIISGWLETIAAGLAYEAVLVAALKALLNNRGATIDLNDKPITTDAPNDWPASLDITVGEIR